MRFILSKLYACRGWILAALGIAVLAMPAAPLPRTNASRILERPGALFNDDIFFGVLIPAAVFLSSVVLRVQARRSIGEHTRGYAHDAERLVMDGVYSRIRHPLYVSNTGVAYSLMLLHLGFTPVAALPVLALVVFEVLLSRMEDRYLEQRFGDAWRKWAKKTPAFFPRLSRAPRAEKETSVSVEFRPRSFEAAFKADASTWLWLLFCIFIIVLRKLV